MKATILFGLLVLLPLIVCSGTSAASEGTNPATNVTVLPEGWLQLPTRELVLDLRHESLEPGSRRDASEFVAAVLNVLLGANYTVRLSDDFIRGELEYYRGNQEVPVEMGRGILNCLERARASGVLDWDCFKGDFSRNGGPTAAERHLPWMAPPHQGQSRHSGWHQHHRFARSTAPDQVERQGLQRCGAAYETPRRIDGGNRPFGR
jgi:hypothetical protein